MQQTRMENRDFQPRVGQSKRLQGSEAGAVGYPCTVPAEDKGVSFGASTEGEQPLAEAFGVQEETLALPPSVPLLDAVSYCHPESDRFLREGTECRASNPRKIGRLCITRKDLSISYN